MQIKMCNNEVRFDIDQNKELHMQHVLDPNDFQVTVLLIVPPEMWGLIGPIDKLAIRMTIEQAKRLKDALPG